MQQATIERRPKVPTDRGFFRFLKFGAVGLAGLVVDSAVLLLFIEVFGFGPYTARIISYLAAATTTWGLNRRYTFGLKGRGAGRFPLLSEWGQFILVNGVGGIVNYGIYVVLIASNAVFYDMPVLAVCIGSAVGWVFNYHASKRLVFDRKRPGP